jgi:hypothetical protein
MQFGFQLTPQGRQEKLLPSDKYVGTELHTKLIQQQKCLGVVSVGFVII